MNASLALRDFFCQALVMETTWWEFIEIESFNGLQHQEFVILSFLSCCVAIFSLTAFHHWCILHTNEIYSHVLREPLLTMAASRMFYLKRAKLNCNNGSNALAAVHEVWCLSSFCNGQPWTVSGPFGYDTRPLEIKMVTNKLLSGLLFYFICSDDSSRDWFPLIQKPDSCMNAIGDMHILAALWESVMTLASYHTRAYTVQAHGQTE